MTTEKILQVVLREMIAVGRIWRREHKHGKYLLYALQMIDLWARRADGGLTEEEYYEESYYFAKTYGKEDEYVIPKFRPTIRRRDS